MALTTSITARNFNPIGLVGQTPGFTDFTDADIATNGFVQTVSRAIELDRSTVLTGILTDTDGKVAVVDAIQAAIELYLPTIFDTVGNTVDGRIFITNVLFTDIPVTGVNMNNAPSLYVDRETVIVVSWTVRVQVS